MVTPVFCCGFECGNNLAHWRNVASGTFDTVTFRSGLVAARCNTSASNQNFQHLLPSAATTLVLRGYIRFASLPLADYELFGSADGNREGAVFKQSDSKIYAGKVTGGLATGTTGVAVTTGVWYRLDVQINATANPWLVDVSVDGVACGQYSEAIASASIQNLRCGMAGGVNSTADIYFDDVIVSQTAADYPIGVGGVESIIPNADGTHTFTTTIAVRGTTGAPTGGGNIAGSSDSWNWISRRPIGGGTGDATRLWNQQSNGSTLYGEVAFESRPSGVQPPRAVEALVIQQDAATGVGDSTFKLNDGGTEATIFATGAVAGIASDIGRTKQFATAPSTGAAWTLAKYNAIRFRFGYSADANPDHYCRGVMIEAEFPPEVIPRTLISRQAVKRAAYV